jgi:hypothetical protein
MGKKYNNTTITPENVQKIYEAMQADNQTDKLYSPMPWGTPEDVKNAYKKGYIYSYNRPNMTPEQIATVEAQATGGKGGGGGGYWGSGRRTTGKVKKVKTTKVKLPKVKQLPITTASRISPAPMAGMANPPIGLPAAPNVAAPSNNLTQLVNMLSGPQRAPVTPAGGQTHTTTPDMGLPAEMAFSLHQMMANFFAQNGGATPENLAAFRSMLAQQGISSPTVTALMQQIFASMQGGVPVAG